MALHKLGEDWALSVDIILKIFIKIFVWFPWNYYNVEIKIFFCTLYCLLFTLRIFFFLQLVSLVVLSNHILKLLDTWPLNCNHFSKLNIDSKFVVTCILVKFVLNGFGTIIIIICAKYCPSIQILRFSDLCA